MNIKFLPIFFLITLVGCNKTTPDAKMYPSDYLLAQRSFPSGKINLKAYRASLTQLDNYRQKNRKFSEPWLFKGPTNICGRVTDIEMPIDDVETIIAGTASGGVYKSENLGEDWEQIFDDQPTQSIGDITISKANTNLIYVGTGESNGGGGATAYDGLGVFKSIDAGMSWRSLGLESVGSIGRVAIDPEDDATVFVAAMGSLFQNNPDRGVFRSTDGGESWEKVLFRSDSTGAIDLVIHPQDGKIIFAALWERKRSPYNRSYGGETSGIYRSTDGGDTWSELTAGLPSSPEDKGRIGLAISESHPEILYAYYAQSEGQISGLFRSDDGGDTWTEKSVENISNTLFMWWFGRITVNPLNPDEVYVTSLTAHRSQDGGDSWSEIFENAHVDHHAFFIHPLDTNIVVNGNDGGVYVSTSGDPIQGKFLPGMSSLQFYTCEINPHNPDLILGGSQDNGTLKSDSSIDNWQQLLPGDGFRVLVHPDFENIIYLETQRGNIFYSEDGGVTISPSIMGLFGEGNWNTPIALDPIDGFTLYTGRQNLFRSILGPNSWDSISPSLVNPDNPTGRITFGTISTIDVSTHSNGVIYVGTDDGNVWVTQDAGSTYNNISEGLPERWITSVVHDPLEASGVYVTVSGFRFGETESQVFYSDDYGESWRDIGRTLPDIPVNDIVADDLLDGKVYIATDIGVFMGENRGDWWSLLGEDLPQLPVLDLDFDSASRRLAAATHGRGIYTYDLPNQTSSTTELIETTGLIFPNPASDEINVSKFAKDAAVSIYDINGQHILTTSQKLIKVASMASGTFLVKSEDGRVERIVKK